MLETNNKEKWYLYIIECKDGRLYTGITNELKRRIKQHNRGRGCRFTRFRIPVKLLYNEVHPSKDAALKREAEIKGWTRDKKLELICNNRDEGMVRHFASLSATISGI